MIVNVPTADDFKNSGIDYLNLAWGTAASLVLDLEEMKIHKGEIYSGEEDLPTTVNEEEIGEYWRRAQRNLATALSLILQGTELLLKGHIAKVSPYLLLSGDPGTWPRGSQENDTNFSEF